MSEPYRHIGGSLLPSNSPEILKPVSTPQGVYQVIPDPEQDTHWLVLDPDGAALVVAEHPNGHSCRALLRRLLEEDLDRVEDQARYIRDCGGCSLSAQEILALPAGGSRLARDRAANRRARIKCEYCGQNLVDDTCPRGCEIP